MGQVLQMSSCGTPLRFSVEENHHPEIAVSISLNALHSHYHCASYDMTYATMTLSDLLKSPKDWELYWDNVDDASCANFARKEY